MVDDNDKPKPVAPGPDDEISEEVLQWIAGGAHGCPACPHTAVGPQYNAGSHILVDGSIFENGQFKGEAIRLVCPRCRRAEQGRASIAHLRPGSDVLDCERCDSRYPVIDGIPVVVNDIDAWNSTHPDAPALARIFANRDAGPLARTIERIASALSGDILDLGCGCGALYTRRDIVGLDWQLEMARGFGGPALVADAGDPPFEASSFDAVLLLNLLDCCSHPGLILAQADALLRPGGTLVVSCPYAWTQATLPERRFTPAELIAALNGELWLGLRSPYQIIEHDDPVAWRLRTSERLVQEFACQVVVAKKNQR